MSVSPAQRGSSPSFTDWQPIEEEEEEFDLVEDVEPESISSPPPPAASLPRPLSSLSSTASETSSVCSQTPLFTIGSAHSLLSEAQTEEPTSFPNTNPASSASVCAPIGPSNSLSSESDPFPLGANLNPLRQRVPTPRTEDVRIDMPPNSADSGRLRGCLESLFDCIRSLCRKEKS